MGNSFTHWVLAVVLLAPLLSPASTHAGAEKPPPSMTWPRIGIVLGPIESGGNYLFLPAHPGELPETLQVALLNLVQRGADRIITAHPCCPERVVDDSLYFPDKPYDHVWRVQLRLRSPEVIAWEEIGVVAIGKTFSKGPSGYIEIDLQSDGRPETIHACFGTEGLNILIGDSNGGYYDQLWRFYHYYNVDIGSTCLFDE